jgi:hypothetical protein
MKRAFNWTLNLIAALSAVVIVWQLAHKYQVGKQGNQEGPKVGSRVQIDGVSFSKGRPAAVLALSLNCGYCRGSAAFYRALSSAASERGVQIVTVLPESKEVYEPSLAMLGLGRSDQVRQANFDSLSVRGTPTIMLVDANSTVQKTWIGKLGESQEKEVFFALGLPPRTSSAADQAPHQPDSSRMSAKELREMMAKPDFVIVDMHERADFKRSHIKGSLNIPLDEADVRFPHEVPRDQAIAIICPEFSPCAVEKRGEGAETACDFVERIVKTYIGFQKAKFVRGNMCNLKAEGLPIEGEPKPKRR